MFNKKYVVGNKIPKWLQKYIDEDFINCKIAYDKTTKSMSLKIKGTRFQHMGSLRLYEKDQIKELSDGKLKIYLYKNQKEPEVWIVECWGKK